MTKISLPGLIIGVIFLIAGGFLTFRQNLSWQKESVKDIMAVGGLVLMIIGLVILIAPLLK